MSILKRIIFIGQAENSAIYFDTKNQVVLKVDKHSLLEMEMTKNSSRKIIPLVIILMSIGIFFAKSGFVNLKVNFRLFIILFLLWSLETIILCYVTEKALYAPIKHKSPNELSLATKSELRQAIMSNNIWNNFKDKRVNLSKKIFLWLMMAAISIVNITIFPLVFMLINQSEKIPVLNTGFIMICLLGVLPFVLIVLLWINNPLRWLNVVEKYQKRKIKYGEK